ncbi:MAG: hypothetical protein IJ064_04835 [Bacteroidaceae bacterium]|nr:hypothetical protein [Bacteroidaceae bacterium]
MRRFLFLMLYVLVACPLSAQQGGMSLIEALQAIAREHPEYTIDILTDSLTNLQTAVQPRGKSVPDDVRRVCKGQPVRVSIDGQHITVQAKGKKRFEVVTIGGNVEDGFLKMPLPEACVSILKADSTVVVDSAQMIRFYGRNMRLVMAHYAAEVSGRVREYLVRTQLDGYEDLWQRVAVDGTQQEVEVPTLRMRKIQGATMKEVVVTATKVKFFWRGDTLVYDATAFQMPQGSMLGDLIRQMPGVTLNDQGEIFVNGRKVDELLLGSHTFFGGNKRVLMENLPYYTVKTLKVYEKQTDKNEALGYDVEPKKYVMDVNLKDEYSRGYIANVEAAGGTDKRYLGRGFLLGFTDRVRTTLLGNINNVNESRHIGQQDHWRPVSMPRSELTTRSVAGEVAYYAKEDKVKEIFRAEFTSTSDEQTMRQRREQYLDGLTPTSQTETFNRRGNNRLNLHNDFTLKKPWTYITADFRYAHLDGSMRSAFEEWADSLTILQCTAGMNEGTTWGLTADAQGTVKFRRPKQHISYYAAVGHEDDKTEEATRYETSSMSTLRHNANDVRKRTTWSAAWLSYHKELAHDLTLSVGDNANVTVTDNHDWIYHPDTLLLPSQLDVLTAITDPSNSYDLHRRRWEHKPGVSLSKHGTYMHPQVHMTVGYQRWSIGMGVPVVHERLSYQRGVIDTIARQTTVILDPSASFRHVWKDGKRDINLHASYKNAPAELLDRIDWRDDSHPLIVKMGNSHLKGTAMTSLSASYYDHTAPRQGMYYLDAKFDYYHRAVSQSVTYNPATGVYTYKPMNISGTYTAKANFSTDRSVGQKRYWTWHVNAGADWNHAKDHAMIVGETASHINTVNTLFLKTAAHIQYDHKGLNVRALGEIRWRHSEGQMRDFAVLNAYEYEYGLTARYTTPELGKKVGALTLAADGMMYSRRGYGSRLLNTDDFVLNASVSQPFLKGKLILRLEAFDLLGQLSCTQYEVNALGRTETWYRSLPRYLMLHVVYHWNRPNSKRKANLD